MIRRRDFVRAFGLGAAGTLLGPLVRRLVAEARGDATDARLLFVLTDGNGWGHQGQPRDPENLDCDLRSATDWDLPAVLEPLAPVRSKVTILRNLYNPHGRNLHGNGWGTLTVAPTDGRNPGGVSLDRFVGHELGREDAFRSIALGVATRPDRAAVSTSADGPSRPFPAIASPTRAFATFFGSAESPDRAIASLAEGRSVLDAVHEDTTRLASRLAGPERSKLDQMLGALRELENQLGERVRVLSERGVPDIDLSDEGTLSAETVRAHVEIAARAFAFGLTRVAHLSVLGLDAHNVGWGFLGFGGDAHESVAHVSGGYDRARATAAYQAIQRFKATELAHLFGLLAAERVGDESLADRAVGIWVNSGWRQAPRRHLDDPSRSRRGRGRCDAHGPLPPLRRPRVRLARIPLRRACGRIERDRLRRSRALPRAARRARTLNRRALPRDPDLSATRWNVDLDD